MTILQQKRKSLHIDIDGFGDSIEADELNLMETAEFPTAGIKSSKSVHFSEIVESHELDKSEEEIKFTWLTVSSSLPWLVAFRFVWCFSQPLTHLAHSLYSSFPSQRYEIDVIHGFNNETAYLISVDHPSLENSNDLCARGLEHRHPDRFKERKSNRRNAFEAVMKEQVRQLEETMTDVESMSNKYRQVALICQLEARERGMNDAKAATAIAGSSRQSSSQRGTKKPFKVHVPHFFKRVLLENKRIQLLCSPEMVNKFESGGSVSSIKVYEIVQAL
jgi:hypothetical protein